MPRTRTLITTAALGAMLLGFAGCSTSDQLTVETTGPAPQINPRAQAILEYNAMNQQVAGIQLGAGDHFGTRVYDTQLARIRYNDMRMLVDAVEDERSND